MKHVCLIIVGAAAGCFSVPNAEIDQARNYLFPHFKTATHGEFDLTAAERTKAIRIWRTEAKTAWTSGVLYELIVDGEGNVVKIRTAQPYLNDDNELYITKAFERIVQGYKFRQDAVPDVFRTFYYPMLLKTEPHVLNEP